MVGSCWQKSAGLLIVIAVFVCSARAQTDLQKIGMEEARKLASEALSRQDPRHQINFSPVENRYDPLFEYFEATWPNPSGSPHLGNFAVNPWNGDVWDVDACKQLKSPSLKKLQKDICKRFKLGNKEYQELKKKTPLCERLIP